MIIIIKNNHDKIILCFTLISVYLIYRTLYIIIQGNRSGALYILVYTNNCFKLKV
jgi:hypothetical protein